MDVKRITDYILSNVDLRKIYPTYLLDALPQNTSDLLDYIRYNKKEYLTLEEWWNDEIRHAALIIASYRFFHRTCVCGNCSAEELFPDYYEACASPIVRHSVKKRFEDEHLKLPPSMYIFTLSAPRCPKLRNEFLQCLMGDRLLYDYITEMKKNSLIRHKVFGDTLHPSDECYVKVLYFMNHVEDSWDLTLSTHAYYLCRHYIKTLWFVAFTTIGAEAFNESYHQVIATNLLQLARRTLTAAITHPLTQAAKWSDKKLLNVLVGLRQKKSLYVKPSDLIFFGSIQGQQILIEKLERYLNVGIQAGIDFVYGDPCGTQPEHYLTPYSIWRLYAMRREQMLTYGISH